MVDYPYSNQKGDSHENPARIIPHQVNRVHL